MLEIKNTLIPILGILIVLSWGNAFGQLDERFGAVGVEGTKYLGQNGLKWYKDWKDSYLPKNYPAARKNKIWTVGKIDYRTDDLGMDYRWIILDLLEDTDIDFLQNFLNLCLAIVNKDILPIVDDYWAKNIPLLETTFEETLNNFIYTDMKYRIKYRAKCKKTDVSFQEELPEFDLSVTEEAINFNTSLTVDWKTHIYIEAWVLNPNPFHWGYHWKDIGDANCNFKTIINISGEIAINGQGRDRHLQIKTITPDSKTESDIDWNTLGIDFKWEGLSNSIEDLIDEQIEKTISEELNKEPITNPYYFVDYFKSLFSEDVIPTQQEILDRIFNGEKRFIEKLIEREEREGEYWSIGYEPNWFPRMAPEQYAEYYTKYHRLIKKLDPGAKMLGPSIFLTEAIENPGDIAFSLIPDIFTGLFAEIEQELKNLINSYFQDTNSKNWYSEFINHLPGDVQVDVNDFHIFPMKADLQTIEWDSVKFQIDDMAGFMQNVSHVEEVWVTEFGNIDGKRSENEAADLCRNFCHYFKTNTVGITKWFWFLSRGHSPFYDLPMAPKPPKTALFTENFTLTQIGRAYLFEADNTPPIIESGPNDGGAYASPQKIIFCWQQAKEYDTGITDYQIQVKSVLKSLTVYNEWIGNRLFCWLTGYSGQTLYARVRAKNGAGLTSDWSNWSDGITIKPVIDDSTDYKVTDDLNSEKMSNRKSLKANFSSQDSDLEKSGSTSINIPNSFKLSQNYPNPFNPTTSINYQLPEDAHVVIKIYNSLGQEIKTLVDEYTTAAYYTVLWDGKDNFGNQVVSGIYLYRIRTRNFICTKKMAVMR